MKLNVIDSQVANADMQSHIGKIEWFTRQLFEGTNEH